jgi:hypothetical protein
MTIPAETQRKLDRLLAIARRPPPESVPGPTITLLMASAEQIRAMRERRERIRRCEA